MSIDYLITVIITTYNRRTLLPYAIQSVLEQSYQNFEIIVINDFGEDVWDIIESFNSDKILYLSHIRNCGLPYARNTALEIAKGDIVCYLDDDDLYLPNHLETIVNTYKQNETDLVYANSYFVEEEVRDGQRIELGRTLPYKESNFSLERLLVSNYIPVNAWTHKRFLIEEVGGFDESLTSLEDWEMLLRFMQYGSRMVNTGKNTVEVRHRFQSKENMLYREKNNLYRQYRYLYDKYPVQEGSVFRKRQTCLFHLARNENKLDTYFKEMVAEPKQLFGFMVHVLSKLRDILLRKK